MMDLSSVYLYRMTHIGNVPHVLQFGITHASSPNANPAFQSIGDSSLIAARNAHVLSNGKLLGEYIPFYFGVRMPMLYVIQKGFNSVTKIQPESIIYCVCSVQAILDHGLEFVFTNGHAEAAFSSEYKPEDVQKIGEILDFNAIKARYWNDENDLDKKRRKEAEFLVATDIPPTAIRAYVVYNEAAKNVLVSHGIPIESIYVHAQSYF